MTGEVGDEFVFPERWRDLRGRDAADEIGRAKVERELSRETAEGHVLFAVSVSAVAACGHCDDVLFALDDGRFACVHLTYVRSAPDRLPWPVTKFLDDGRGVVEYVEGHVRVVAAIALVAAFALAQSRVQPHLASTQKVRSFCGLGTTRRTATDAKNQLTAFSMRLFSPRNRCYTLKRNSVTSPSTNS